MSLSFRPFSNAAGRIVRRRAPTMASVCDRQITVHPQETDQRPAAFFMDGELDRITRLQEETTTSLEEQRVRGGTVEHRATLAYEMSDAIVTSDAVHLRGARFPLVHTRPRPLPVRRLERIADGSMIATPVSNRYFGHYLADECVTGILAQDYAPALTGPKRYWHEAEYEVLAQTHPRPVTAAHVDRLFMFDDVGQNRNKRDRFRMLRERVRSLPGRRKGHGVFIRRGASGVARILTNENEIEARLKQLGFSIIDLTTSTVADIVREAKDAALFVGVEGSGPVHAFLAIADGASTLNILPPYRFTAGTKDYCDALGLRFGFVIGDAVPGGFHLPLDRLAAAMDHANVAISS